VVSCADAINDPVGDRLMVSRLRYMGSAQAHDSLPLVTQKIALGDYGSEHGLLTGIHSGLLVHSVPIVQYLARGRRPFDPYTFPSGGSVKVTGPKGAPGEGRIRLRIPEGRTTMLTTASNPAAEPLELEISVNGVAQRTRIGAGETTHIETPARGGSAPLAIVFRGNRRLVLLETDVR
jgi:hypothetical protein